MLAQWGVAQVEDYYVSLVKQLNRQNLTFNLLTFNLELFQSVTLSKSCKTLEEVADDYANQQSPDLPCLHKVVPRASELIDHISIGLELSESMPIDGRHII